MTISNHWTWVEPGIHATCYCSICGTVTSWRLVKVIRDTDGDLTAEGVYSCSCCGKKTTRKEDTEWTTKQFRG